MIAVCTRPDLAAEHLAYSDRSRNTLDPEAVDEALGVCATDHPQHKPIDWNCNGVIDPGPVVDPLLRALGTVISDHDDYAALGIAPLAPQDRGSPAMDKLGVVPAAPARVGGPCFAVIPKRAPKTVGPICPHPSPVR